MEIRKTGADGKDLLLAIRERIESWLAAEHIRPPRNSSRSAELHQVNELCRSAAEKYNCVGHMPPSPPTLRGRAGRFLIRILQRALAWYTCQIIAVNGLLVRIAKALAEVVYAMDDRLSAAERVQDADAEALTELRQDFEKRLCAIEAAAERRHATDALYVAFENVYRGTREDIENRFRIYLPRLKAAGVGSPEMPVVDVGCGRGEWLELLTREGLVANGVDVNRAMVLECRKRGLNATESDLIPYVRNLPDSSVGAVTGFHVVEHLSFDALVDLLDETVRVLKPDGLAIFETPNPANLLVAACSFYTDPTHRNPLPAQTLTFLAEARGLGDIEVLALHPPPDDLRIKDDGSEAVRWLNEHFYSAQDYAMIGRKP